MIGTGLLAFAAVLAVIVSAPAARADQGQVRNWKLHSWVVEEVESKETKLVFGEQPNGYLILTREGRMMQARKAPQSDAERDAVWVGTEQAREYRINGTKLQVLSPPAPIPAFGGKPARGIFTFEHKSD
jgi:hypothetical protein